MDDALRERVETLERAVTDGDHDLSAFTDEAEAVERLDSVETAVTDLEDRIEKLEAATQALRGYVGNIRSVNADIERRADAALARVEALDDETATSNAASKRDTTAAPDQTERHRERDDNRAAAPSQRTENSRQRVQKTAANRDNSGDDPGTETHTARDRCTSCGRPHEKQAEYGGPTVESLASAEQNSQEKTGTARASDGNEELLPDGDADPLVGAAETSTGRTDGTLQRIRDLL